MSIFFTADTHFGHKWMAEEHRCLGTTDLMDEWIIDQWNNMIGPKDQVYHLGDFSFGGFDHARKMFTALNGHKFLVPGNHDSSGVIKNLGWANSNTKEWTLIKRKFEGQSIVLCHYPLMTWQNAHHGTWHLHGHSHGNLPHSKTTRMDVGVDTNIRLAPYPLEFIVEKFQGLEYDKVDHH